MYPVIIEGINEINIHISNTTTDSPVAENPTCISADISVLLSSVNKQSKPLITNSIIANAIIE